MNKNIQSALQQKENNLPVSRSLEKKIYNQLSVEKKTTLPLIFGFGTVAGLAAICAIIFLPFDFQHTTSPTSPSFLQSVQAAYDERVSQLQTEGLIHHTRITNKQNDTNSKYTNTIETWESIDDTKHLYQYSNAQGVIEEVMLTVDNTDYYTPQQIAIQKQSYSEIDNTVCATTIDCNKPYVVESPENVSSTSYEIDPEDPNVTCISYEYYDEDTLQTQNTIQKIVSLISSNPSDTQLNDPVQMHTIIQRLIDTTELSDEGEVQDQDVGLSHRYSIEYSIENQKEISEHQKIHFDFFFDTSTYLLKKIITTGTHPGSPEMTQTTIIEQDEFVTLSSLPSNLFSPEAHGLQKLPEYIEEFNEKNHPENLPKIQLEEGCYKEGKERPIRLSPEEEKVVKERIAALYKNQ